MDQARLQTLLRSRTAHIVFIFLVAFVLQTSYSLYFKVPPVVDAQKYDTVGWNLAQGNGYEFEAPNVPLRYDGAIERVGPGYQFLLGGIYSVFGHQLAAVWIIQAYLFGLSSILVYALTYILFKDDRHVKWMALIAGLLIATNADLITVGSMILTESVAVFLVICQMYLTLRLPDRTKYVLAHTLLLGIVSALSILVRTTSILLLVVSILYLGYKKKYFTIGMSLLLLVLVFLPWVIRNENLYHQFVWSNVALGENLLAGNHPGATGEFVLLPPDLVQATITPDPLVHNKITMKLAEQFILTNPGTFIVLCAERTMIFFSSARPSAFWFHLHGIQIAVTALLASGYFFILSSIGAFGLVKNVLRSVEREQRMKYLYLLANLLAVLAPIVILVAETRYRFPVYPILAVFTGWAVIMVYRERKLWRPLALSGALFISITAIDLATHVSVLLGKVASFH